MNKIGKMIVGILLVIVVFANSVMTKDTVCKDITTQKDCEDNEKCAWCSTKDTDTNATKSTTAKKRQLKDFTPHCAATGDKCSSQHLMIAGVSLMLTLIISQGVSGTD